MASPPSRRRRVRTDPAPRQPRGAAWPSARHPLGRRVLTYPWPLRPGRRVSIVCAPHRACRSPTGRARCKRRRVRTDPASCHPARRGLTVRAPPPGHRVLTYPRPARPGRRVSTGCVPCRKCWTTPGPTTGTKRRRVRADHSPRHPTRVGPDRPCATLGRRVLTYPRPARLGRRVSTVCAPRRACRSPTGFVRCKRRRVRADPSPRQPMRRGLTVRAPPSWHRVPTYPWPLWPGRRVRTVRVPWQSPPSPRRPAAPAAPGGLAPHPCQSPHPDLPTHPPTHRPVTRIVYGADAIQPPVRFETSPGIPPLHMRVERGRGVRHHTSRGHHRVTTHQAPPAIQVPPHPRPCSTAATGLSPPPPLPRPTGPVSGVPLRTRESTPPSLSLRALERGPGGEAHAPRRRTWYPRTDVPAVTPRA